MLQSWSYPEPGGGSRCLDLKFVRGGTQSSGYRQWPPCPPWERPRTRRGGNILSPHSLFESLCVGIPKQWCSMADTWRPTIRVDVAMFSVEPSHAAVSREPLLLSGSHEARGNHNHDPRTIGTPCIRDAWGFCFSAVAPPFHRPVPIDEWNFGPLVSAWVCGARSEGTKRRAQWAAACRGG
jgi:hypothetical protein